MDSSWPTAAYALFAVVTRMGPPRVLYILVICWNWPIKCQSSFFRECPMGHSQRVKFLKWAQVSKRQLCIDELELAHGSLPLFSAVTRMVPLRILNI